MPGTPTLRVSPQDAERAITHALTTGNNFNYSAWTGAEWRQTEKRVVRWYEDTTDTLRGLFTTPEIAEQFMGVSHNIGPSVAPDDKRYQPVKNTFENRMAWLRRLQENLTIYAPTTEQSHPVKVDYEKITIMGLVHHLPLKLWIGIGSAVIVVFLLGVTFGQTTFVQEMVGKHATPQLAPKLSTEELKATVDELTKGHNDRLKSLTDTLGDLNRKYDYSTDSAKVSIAIEDTKKQIDSEHAKYQADVGALRQTNSTK